jgi:hypothetical protein
MKFAPKPRDLLTRRGAIYAGLAVGVIAAVISLYKITLLPPSLHKRELQIGAASTTLLIDLKGTEITDLAPTLDQLTGLASQAGLLGDVMVTDPVLSEIGRIAHIDPSQIQATAPVTSNVPRTLIEPDSGANATDLIASPRHYKLQIQADPTLPILHVYTQAPSAGAAIRLANASVQGLQAYLSHLNTTQAVTAKNQVRVVELGTPHGGIANGGASMEIALLAFITGLAVTLAGIAAFVRVRHGWQLAGMRAQAQR